MCQRHAFIIILSYLSHLWAFITKIHAYFGIINKGGNNFNNRGLNSGHSIWTTIIHTLTYHTYKNYVRIARKVYTIVSYKKLYKTKYVFWSQFCLTYVKMWKNTGKLFVTRQALDISEKWLKWLRMPFPSL